MSDYLDCNATAPIDPRVQAEVIHHFEVEFGNSASPHEFGKRAKAAVQRARDRVGAVVEARRHEVFFTSGATESNNLAIFGLIPFGQENGKRHIVSTQIEHRSVLEPLAELARRGVEVTLVRPGNDGRVTPRSVVDAMRPDTFLVSVMHVNNETGVIQPIAELADAMARFDAFLHVDAAQGFGKDLEPLRHPRIDLISISGHKIYGPQGIGALILRRRNRQRLPLRPLQFGGGQELGLRPGTLPVPLIAGLGKASELALVESASRAGACRRIRRQLWTAIECLSPVVHGATEFTLPHVLNVSFPGVDSEEAIEALQGVAAVSNGSACTAVCATRSHVLTAMGSPLAESDGALRFSWFHKTQLSNLDRMVNILRRLQNAGLRRG